MEKNGTERIVEIKSALIHYGKPCVSVTYVGKGKQRHHIRVESLKDASRSVMIKEGDGSELSFGLGCGDL